MTMMYFAVFICVLSVAIAFTPTSRMTTRSTKLSMGLEQHLINAGSMFTALEAAKPDDYVYGAVAAPDFVLPLAAFGIIAIAAVPFVLAPGEEALERQREDEAIKGNAFNKRKDKDLP